MTGLQRLGATGASLLAAVFLLSACKPAGPPTSATGSAKGSGANYTVTVSPVGPMRWSYTVNGTANGAPAAFDSVQVHSESDISKCGIFLSDPDPASELTQSHPTPGDVRGDFAAAANTPTGTKGWSVATFTLECDMKNGSVTFLIDDAGGNGPEQVSVGPLAGPAPK